MCYVVFLSMKIHNFKKTYFYLKNKQTNKWKTLQQNDTQAYLSGFYFQFVNIERVPLQSTGSQWQKLLQSFNIFLDFKHCFWRHSTNFFLNLFLFLHKFPKKRKLSFKKNTPLIFYRKKVHLPHVGQSFKSKCFEKQLLKNSSTVHRMAVTEF